MNGVRSGNLKPKVFCGRDLDTLDGGGLRPAIFENPAPLPFCRTDPHWALHTSSRRIASRGHSRANWAQLVMRREAHWG